MKPKQYLDDKTEKLDDIDRLFQLTAQSDPAPGRAFKDTLEQLRQGVSKMEGNEGKSNTRRYSWRTMAITGLGAAAVLAVGLVAISALAITTKETPSTIVSLPTVPAVVATPVPTSSPAPTWQVNVYQDTSTAIATTTTNQPTAIPTQKTIAVTVQVFPDATPTPSSPVRINPPTLNTPIVKPGKPIAVGPVEATVIGKVVSFDKDRGIIKVSSGGTIRTIKIMPNAAITKKGVAANVSEIVEGMNISATGNINAQAQIEAVSITLDETKLPSDPGYPNEKE